MLFCIDWITGEISKMGKVVKTSLLCTLRPCKSYTRQYSLVHWGGHASLSGVWSCDFVQGFHRKPVNCLIVASDINEGKSRRPPGSCLFKGLIAFPHSPWARTPISWWWPRAGVPAAGSPPHAGTALHSQRWVNFFNLPICQSRKNNILIFCAFLFFCCFCFPLFFHFHRKDQRG